MPHTNTPQAIAGEAKAASAGMRPTRIRHVVLWLTVAAYMITYMDRVVIASAAPSIRAEFGFSLITMGWLLAAFRWGYALFQLPGGWLGDRIGPRRALSVIVTFWSFFTTATAFCWNAPSMLVTRFLFGAGEAGAFPIATRSLSRWMMSSEKGYAQGLTHAGSRFGAAVSPPIVVWMIAAFGWRMPFVVFGALGIGWAVIWYWYYRDTPREHKSVNAAELALIHSDIGDRSSRTESIPWKAILSSRMLWLISAMYFCYGYCISIYLDWFPFYLAEHRGFNLKEMGFYASLPLLAGAVGALTGGWLSDLWLKRTGNLVMARRIFGIIGFLIAGVCIVPATLTPDPIMGVAWTCLAVFGLEITIGVTWALPLDIGADFAGSVSAVMNTCGNIGGAISPSLFAFLVGGYGWNQPFFVASGLCFVAAILYSGINANRRILVNRYEN